MLKLKQIVYKYENKTKSIKCKFNQIIKLFLVKIIELKTKI